ncbi:MAG: hypothetical protein JSR58_04790 [Verrucomicrobia bacterium]|nr:hypothetical protein [Verrucomicrobiota bacterium]
MSSIRDLASHLQEKYTDKDTFFASPEDFAFFQKPAPKPVKHQEPEPTPAKPLKPAQKASYIDNLRSIASKAAPQLAQKETIPDDSVAKKVGSLWQDHLQDVHVAILSFGAVGRDLEFLQNVAAAITSLLAPAQVIDGFKMEAEKKWDLFFEKTPLKLVLAPPLTAWKGKLLARHFRENPTTRESSFSAAAAILLRPIREYLQTPSLKRDLWKTIVSHLSP